VEADSVAFLQENFPEKAELALWTRNVVLASDPELSERIYRGWRGVGFRHPEAGYVCAVFPKDEHVELVFEHGAGLPDPAGVLGGEGHQTRVLRIEQPDGELGETISAYVQQAIAQRLLGFDM
jgi:hypothetical protein